MNTPARKQYLAGEVTHAAYYRAIAKTAGFSCNDPEFLEQICRALDAGDEHLNTIPPDAWCQAAIPLLPHAEKAFEAHGDFYSDAGVLCVLKQAAKDAVLVKQEISLDNLDTEAGYVMAYLIGPDAHRIAKDLQTVGGSLWKSDDGFAYATLVDHPGLVEELEKEGYEVDDSQYSRPELEEEIDAWVDGLMELTAKMNVPGDNEP